jgi:hypothetical protein
MVLTHGSKTDKKNALYASNRAAPESRNMMKITPTMLTVRISAQNQFECALLSAAKTHIVVGSTHETPKINPLTVVGKPSLSVPLPVRTDTKTTTTVRRRMKIRSITEENWGRSAVAGAVAGPSSLLSPASSSLALR